MTDRPVSEEKHLKALSGWTMLAIQFLMLVGTIALFAGGANRMDNGSEGSGRFL